jgi:hypothetical protein
MRKRKYEIRDRRGNLVEDDGSGVLKDGHTLRVPLWLCDSTDELQLSVAEDAEARKPLVVDGFGRPAGQRPGACYARPAAAGTADAAVQTTARAMRTEALNDSVAESPGRVAWRRRRPRDRSDQQHRGRRARRVAGPGRRFARRLGQEQRPPVRSAR